jgi:hypothetical protein
VLGALDRLGTDDRSLDVWRLTDSVHFRLRVRDWRVIFDAFARRPTVRTVGRFDQVRRRRHPGKR